MLIQNYGLFWRREHIEWGAGSRRGHLNGVYAYGKREGTVDFREQRAVYVLYDDGFRMVYVGQAGRTNGYLFDRLKAHTRNRLAERWSKFSWFGIRGLVEDTSRPGQYMLDKDAKFDTTLDQVLDHIEGILIEAAEPSLNRKGSQFGYSTYLYNQQKKHVPLAAAA